MTVTEVVLNEIKTNRGITFEDSQSDLNKMIQDSLELLIEDTVHKIEITDENEILIHSLNYGKMPVKATDLVNVLFRFIDFFTEDSFKLKHSITELNGWHELYYENTADALEFGTIGKNIVLPYIEVLCILHHNLVEVTGYTWEEYLLEKQFESLEG